LKSTIKLKNKNQDKIKKVNSHIQEPNNSFHHNSLNILCQIWTINWLN